MILADESVDAPIVAALRTAGFSVESIAEDSPSITDDAVLDRANASTAILLTGDKDFGELVFRQKKVHHGVVLLRLSGLTADEKAALVVDVFQRHEWAFAGRFTVVSQTGIRIRST